MLKLITVGLIGVMSTAAGAGLALTGWLGGGAGAEDAEVTPKFESVATELTAVPLISGGKVTGYLVLRVSSTVDMSKVKDADVALGPYLSDAAFRAVFDFASGGVSEVKAKDIELLTRQIEANAEERLGADTIGSVKLEQFNLVSAAEIRDKFVKPQ